MERIETIVDNLKSIEGRYANLKSLFNVFQKNLEGLNANTFPLKGIGVTNIDDVNTEIIFLDEKYTIRFSAYTKDDVLMGRIKFFIKHDLDDNLKELKAFLFNGTGKVDIDQPQKEDPINLNEDSCCMNIVLNTIHEYIKSKT